MDGVSAREEGTTILLPLPLYPAVTPNVRGHPERQKDRNTNKSSLHVISTIPKIVTLLFSHHSTDWKTKAWRVKSDPESQSWERAKSHLEHRSVIQILLLET